MPKKLQYLLPILPACGGLVAQLDAHPFGALVFAVMVLAGMSAGTGGFLKNQPLTGVMSKRTSAGQLCLFEDSPSIAKSAAGLTRKTDVERTHHNSAISDARGSRGHPVRGSARDPRRLRARRESRDERTDALDDAGAPAACIRDLGRFGERRAAVRATPARPGPGGLRAPGPVLMSVVSIAEASRLTGRSRASLYRSFKAGELSKSELPGGQAGVDVSELMRVFGALQGVPEAAADGQASPTAAEPAVAVLEERIRGLEAQLAMKDELVDELRRRVQDKDEIAEELRGQVRLLLMPPDRPAERPPEPNRRGILSRILGRG